MENRPLIVQKESEQIPTEQKPYRITNPGDYDNLFEESNKWVEYKFNHGFNSQERRTYEDFVYGYLYYYAVITRNGSKIFKIGFKWQNEKNEVAKKDDKATSVCVYLDPPADDAGSPYVNEKFDPQVDFKKDKYGMFLTSIGSKDPQPPPPPPPPNAA
jgi:hypothetical protein